MTDTLPMTPAEVAILRNSDNLGPDDYRIRRLIATVEEAEVERDKLQEHFDNCSAEKIVTAKLERDQWRARAENAEAGMRMAEAELHSRLWYKRLNDAYRTRDAALAKLAVAAEALEEIIRLDDQSRLDCNEPIEVRIAREALAKIKEMP